MVSRFIDWSSIASHQFKRHQSQYFYILLDVTVFSISALFWRPFWNINVTDMCQGASTHIESTEMPFVCIFIYFAIKICTKNDKPWHSTEIIFSSSLGNTIYFNDTTSSGKLTIEISTDSATNLGDVLANPVWPIKPTISNKCMTPSVTTIKQNCFIHVLNTYRRICKSYFC